MNKQWGYAWLVWGTDSALEKLRDLGLDGWELVAFGNDKLWFKRPLDMPSKAPVGDGGGQWEPSQEQIAGLARVLEHGLGWNLRAYELAKAAVCEILTWPRPAAPVVVTDKAIEKVLIRFMSPAMWEVANEDTRRIWRNEMRVALEAALGAQSGPAVGEP